MTDIAQKILATNSAEIKHSKDGVIVYEYDGKKYYVKKLPLDTKTFKILLSFELLKYMGVKVSNIITKIYDDGFAQNIHVFSEECGEEAVAKLEELPNNPKLQNEIAKIIYASDLLGLGDIANDNIIKSKNGDLYLIDFEPMGENGFFGTLNPFGKMGDDDYSIARSFDLHNTKGNFTKIADLPPVGAKTTLSLDEISKSEIEKKFFSLDRKKLKEIIDSVVKSQFPLQFIGPDLPKVVRNLTDRYVELSKSRGKIKKQENKDIDFTQISPVQITPQSSKTSSRSSFVIFEDSKSIGQKDQILPEKDNKTHFRDMVNNKTPTELTKMTNNLVGTH